MNRNLHELLNEIFNMANDGRWIDVTDFQNDKPRVRQVNGVRRLCNRDINLDIKQIIYNDPATIVIFADGSKVCVKASKNDKFDKEVGLMYAIVKRLYANDVDKNGYVKSTGLGQKMSKLVNEALDQKAKKDDEKKKKNSDKNSKHK